MIRKMVEIGFFFATRASIAQNCLSQSWYVCYCLYVAAHIFFWSKKEETLKCHDGFAAPQKLAVSASCWTIPSYRKSSIWNLHWLLSIHWRGKRMSQMAVSPRSCAELRKRGPGELVHCQIAMMKERCSNGMCLHGSWTYWCGLETVFVGFGKE